MEKSAEHRPPRFSRPTHAFPPIGWRADAIRRTFHTLNVRRVNELRPAKRQFSRFGPQKIDRKIAKYTGQIVPLRKPFDALFYGLLLHLAPGCRTQSRHVCRLALSGLRGRTNLPCPENPLPGGHRPFPLLHDPRRLAAGGKCQSSDRGVRPLDRLRPARFSGGADDPIGLGRLRRRRGRLRPALVAQHPDVRRCP